MTKKAGSLVHREMKNTLSEFVNELNLNLTEDFTTEINDFIQKIKIPRVGFYAHRESLQRHRESLQRQVLRFIRRKTRNKRVYDLVNRKLTEYENRTILSKLKSRLRGAFTRRQLFESTKPEPVHGTVSNRQLPSKLTRQKVLDRFQKANLPPGQTDAVNSASHLGQTDAVPASSPFGPASAVTADGRQILPVNVNFSEKATTECKELQNVDDTRQYTTASIMLITRFSKVIVVQLKDNTWSIPGGIIDSTDQSVYAAALREFKEETGFAIDHALIVETKIFLYRDVDVVYVIKSDQDFPRYKKSRKTIALKYVPLANLWRYPLQSTQCIVALLK
jgi:ADP-ribose pyrophosphatase YjhB (NUDIX family)